MHADSTEISMHDQHFTIISIIFELLMMAAPCVIYYQRKACQVIIHNVNLCYLLDETISCCRYGLLVQHHSKKVKSLSLFINDSLPQYTQE